MSEKPHKESNLPVWTSAGLTITGTLIFTHFYFKDIPVGGISFKLGVLSPWASALPGIISGIIVVLLAEYHTSHDYKPTQLIAPASKRGLALTITGGLRQE